PQLQIPDAFPEPPMTKWGLSRDREAPTQARVIYPAKKGDSLRVEFFPPTTDDPYKIQLQREDLAVSKGRAYAFDLRIRATSSRPFQFALTQGRRPFERLGLEDQLVLTPEWQTVHREFLATGDDYR